MRYGGLIAAVVVAALAAIIVLRMSNDTQPAPAVGASPAAEQIKTAPVYVAAKAIPVGATITADMVVSQPWPEQLILNGFVAADGKTNLVGMIARSPFQQNEPVILSKLANPNDPNFISGDLPKGMRVVTIPVNETDGVAGFVFPGDHVDLIYTHDVDKWEYAPSAPGSIDAVNGTGSTAQKAKQTITETLLTNVKVLAIDQRASGAGATDKDGNLLIPRSASLMVSQADAQRVRLAQKTGSLSMVLRALVDKESADPLVLTGPKDVSQSKDGGDDVGPTSDSGVKIVRGAPRPDKETESSGTSVSRGAAGSNASAASGLANPVAIGSGTGNAIVNPGLVAIP